MDWLNGLEPMLKAYWIIASVASVIFVIQTILSLFGVDGSDTDAGFDVSGDEPTDGPFPFLSLRNLVNFCIGFGWGGGCFSSVMSSNVAIAICAYLVGIAFVLLFFFLLRFFLRLGRDNTFRISETVGHIADVYLTIPAAGAGHGKIQISIRGSVHELDAITRGEKIPTGAKAKVVEVPDNQMVIVEKI